MNYKEVARITISVFLIGMGMVLVAKSNGDFIRIAIGFLSIGLGVALISTK